MSEKFVVTINIQRVEHGPADKPTCRCASPSRCRCMHSGAITERTKDTVLNLVVTAETLTSAVIKTKLHLDAEAS